LLVLCPNWQDAKRKQWLLSMIPMHDLSQHPLQVTGVHP